MMIEEEDKKKDSEAGIPSQMPESPKDKILNKIEPK
jgi:hypothetical protein